MDIISSSMLVLVKSLKWKHCKHIKTPLYFGTTVVLKVGRKHSVRAAFEVNYANRKQDCTEPILNATNLITWRSLQFCSCVARS